LTGLKQRRENSTAKERKREKEREKERERTREGDRGHKKRGE